MSCKAEYPAGASECPICYVPLSQVRRCPECQRTQSANHLRCIYCSGSLVPKLSTATAAAPAPGTAKAAREPGAAPLPFPLELARPRVPSELVIIGMLVVVIGLILFIRLRPGPEVEEGPIGQSYVLHATSLYQDPSLNAAPLKTLNPPAVVEIFDDVVDALGKRWLHVTSEGIKGYVLARELAPPKGTDPERSFDLLKHYVQELDDPAVLPEATAAAEYYRRAFPDSSHLEEVTWFLAECTRRLAERNGQRALLDNAKQQYTKIAEGKGEFAERARQALSGFPAEGRAGAPRRPPRPSGLRLSVVGGSLTSSPPGSSAVPNAPVRRLTVLSRTPIPVRLTAPLQVSSGVDFQALVDDNILVNSEIAVPKGSLSLLTVAGVQASAATRAPAVTLQLTGIVVDHQTYGITAEAVRVDPPPNTSQTLASNRASPQLPPGTRVVFRLTSPLVVVRR